MGQRYSLLAIDDHQPNLMAVRIILQDLGMIVYAPSGEEALRRLLDQDFDLILLDILMPTMDGIETANLIRQRERSKDIPILFMSALEDMQSRLGALHSTHNTDCVAKPFTSEMLRSKVEGMLGLA